MSNESECFSATSKVCLNKHDHASCRTNTSEVGINRYSFYGYISEGSYCKVRVVQSKTSKKRYAMKYMPVSRCSSSLKSMVQERNVLAELSYPFLCNLHFAFQDHGFMFMLLDLMPGGDLRYYLENYTMSEKAIKILIGEISSAIDYVHSKSLVHRDVKPENILLDELGHAHLCDFNVAASLSYEKPSLRKAIGTFNYMAPEMHRGMPYGEQVDWWALGVVFYECVYGQMPFKGNRREEMVAQMSRGPRYKTSEFNISPACCEAIQQFLKYSPYERIKDSHDVFRLPFFKGSSKEILENAYKSQQCGAFRVPEKELVDLSTKCNRRNVLVHEFDNWLAKGCKSNRQQRHYENPGPASKLKNKIRECGGKLNECVFISFSRSTPERYNAECEKHATTSGCAISQDNNMVFRTYINHNSTHSGVCETNSCENRKQDCDFSKSLPSLTMSSSATLNNSPISPSSDEFIMTSEKKGNKWIMKPLRLRNRNESAISLVDLYN